jgi:hypothetical protein
MVHIYNIWIHSNYFLAIIEDPSKLASTAKTTQQSVEMLYFVIYVDELSRAVSESIEKMFINGCVGIMDDAEHIESVIKHITIPFRLLTKCTGIYTKIQKDLAHVFSRINYDIAVLSISPRQLLEDLEQIVLRHKNTEKCFRHFAGLLLRITGKDAIEVEPEPATLFLSENNQNIVHTFVDCTVKQALFLSDIAYHAKGMAPYQFLHNRTEAAEKLIADILKEYPEIKGENPALLKWETQSV